MRMLPDMELQFLGRTDDQVKIHGVRIEPGELEACLNRHDAIKSCRVVLREDGRSLIAYIVPAGKRAPSFQELRRELLELFPEAMIPTHFVSLDRLPLTPSGKLDRTKLKSSDIAPKDPPASDDPRTPDEHTMASIWSETLGVTKVGIHDNFFELGGDSIISLLTVAKATRAGFAVTVPQLFENPTVASLTAVAGTAKTQTGNAHRTASHTAVPLTPNQHWFFEKDSPNPSYFNQGLMIPMSEPGDPRRLETALQALVEHHDALRLRFREGPSGWEQRIVPECDGGAIHCFDLTAIPGARINSLVEQICQSLHEGLDLQQGPLHAAGLITLGEERRSVLILILHHVAVDGVSWRVLLEDLDLALEQANSGAPIALPPPSASLAEWSEALLQRARSADLDSEIEYWNTQVPDDATRLPRDFETADQKNTVGSARTVTVSLDAARTEMLMRWVPALYGATQLEVLVAALAQTLTTWSGSGTVTIDMESHGRQRTCETDPSRLVGWFTTRFPLTLRIDPAAAPASWIQATRTALRRVPSLGQGWGCLRYLRQDNRSSHLREAPSSDVSFNYFGRLDPDGGVGFSMGPLTETPGSPRHPGGSRTNLLEVNARRTDAGLSVDWTFWQSALAESTVEAKAARFMETLRQLLGPIEARDNLDGVEDVYELSPMQHGILFECLVSPHRQVYFNQSILQVRGHLDVNVFRSAWKLVVARHPILRTAFVWERLPRPVQVVYRRIELPVEYEDHRNLDAESQRQELSRLLRHDRDSGIRLDEAPLTRITVIQTGDETYQIVWSRHHILLDGWSAANVWREVFTAYEILMRNAGEPNAVNQMLGPTPQYGGYIRWLRQRDAGASEAYWRQRLGGLTEGTLIAGEKKGTQFEPGERQQAEESLLVDADTTAAIDNLLRSGNVTVSSMALGLWALLLVRLTGRTDVVFGLTTSGRPSELPNVDRLVGLMINTLPFNLSVPQDGTTLSWLRKVQREQIRIQENQYVSLAEMRGWSGLSWKDRMFDTIVVSGNYPAPAAIGKLTSIEVSGARSLVETSLPLTLRVEPARCILFQLLYRPDCFPKSWIHERLTELERMIRALVRQPDISPGELLDTLPRLEARIDLERES